MKSALEPLPNPIRRDLVNCLLQIPSLEKFSGRSTLLQGLPRVPLTRSEEDARTDLNQIITGLHGLGRLSKDGTRPLIVLVDNALEALPPESELAQELEEVKRRLAEFYGGDIQAPIQAEQPDLAALEALVFGRQRDTRLAFSFIEGATRTARSVARLIVPRIVQGLQQPGAGYGTGWLIAPGIIITNQHVIENRDPRFGDDPASSQDFQAQAEGLEAWFDYYQEVGARATPCSGARLLASSRALDYAVLELVEAAKVAERDPLPVAASPPRLVLGSRMNLVQHPRGGALRFAIRNNFFVRRGDEEHFIRYQTDSEPGSSGSPVCDDAWQVVGLHHASTPVPAEQVPQEVVQGQPVTVKVLNEAIDIHSILADLPPEIQKVVRTPAGAAGA